MTDHSEIGTRPELQRHYTVNELAKQWNMHPSTVRRIFLNLPGVLKRKGPGRLIKKAKPYVTLRIPEAVALAWYRENAR